MDLKAKKKIKKKKKVKENENKEEKKEDQWDPSKEEEAKVFYQKKVEALNKKGLYE